MKFNSKAKDKAAKTNKREWIEALIIITIGLFMNTFVLVLQL